MARLGAVIDRWMAATEVSISAVQGWIPLEGYLGVVPCTVIIFARFSTDDTAGKIRGYVDEGGFTDDHLHTFGAVGVVQTPRMQKLRRYICENGFEHQVAANLSTVASAVHEVTSRYFGWDLHWLEDTKRSVRTSTWGENDPTQPCSFTLFADSVSGSISRFPDQTTHGPASAKPATIST